MLFEKLIEQHRVHRFIADGVRFSLLVTGHQVGIHLLHLLSHQPELWDGFRIKLMLVVEGDRFECQDRFARLVHRFDRVLETLRRNDRAELSVRPHNNTYTRGHGDSADASDKGGPLRASASDADLGLLIGATTSITNIDIVAPGHQSVTRQESDRNVAVTSRVVLYRLETAGCVIDPAVVEQERFTPAGRVVVAGCVIQERIKTYGRVVVAG